MLVGKKREEKQRIEKRREKKGENAHCRHLISPAVSSRHNIACYRA